MDYFLGIDKLNTTQELKAAEESLGSEVKISPIGFLLAYPAISAINIALDTTAKTTIEELEQELDPDKLDGLGVREKATRRNNVAKARNFYQLIQHKNVTPILSNCFKRAEFLVEQYLKSKKINAKELYNTLLLIDGEKMDTARVSNFLADHRLLNGLLTQLQEGINRGIPLMINRIVKEEKRIKSLQAIVPFPNTAGPVYANQKQQVMLFGNNNQAFTYKPWNSQFEQELIGDGENSLLKILTKEQATAAGLTEFIDFPMAKIKNYSDTKGAFSFTVYEQLQIPQSKQANYNLFFDNTVTDRACIDRMGLDDKTVDYKKYYTLLGQWLGLSYFFKIPALFRAENLLVNKNSEPVVLNTEFGHVDFPDDFGSALLTGTGALSIDTWNNSGIPNIPGRYGNFLVKKSEPIKLQFENNFGLNSDFIIKGFTNVLRLMSKQAAAITTWLGTLEQQNVPIYIVAADTLKLYEKSLLIFNERSSELVNPENLLRLLNSEFENALKTLKSKDRIALTRPDKIITDIQNGGIPLYHVGIKDTKLFDDNNAEIKAVTLTDSPTGTPAVHSSQEDYFQTSKLDLFKDTLTRLTTDVGTFVNEASSNIKKSLEGQLSNGENFSFDKAPLIARITAAFAGQQASKIRALDALENFSQKKNSRNSWLAYELNPEVATLTDFEHFHKYEHDHIEEAGTITYAKKSTSPLLESTNKCAVEYTISYATVPTGGSYIREVQCYYRKDPGVSPKILDTEPSNDKLWLDDYTAVVFKGIAPSEANKTNAEIRFNYLLSNKRTDNSYLRNQVSILQSSALKPHSALDTNKFNEKLNANMVNETWTTTSKGTYFKTTFTNATSDANSLISWTRTNLGVAQDQLTLSVKAEVAPPPALYLPITGRLKPAPDFGKIFPGNSMGIEIEFSGLTCALPESASQQFAWVRGRNKEPLVMITKDIGQGRYGNPAKLDFVNDKWNLHTLELVTYPCLIDDAEAIKERNDAIIFLTKLFTDRTNNNNHASLPALKSGDGRFEVVIATNKHILASGSGASIAPTGQTIGISSSGQQMTVGIKAKDFGSGNSDLVKLLEKAKWYTSAFQNDEVIKNESATFKNVYAYLLSIAIFTTELCKKHGISIREWKPSEVGIPEKAKGLTDPIVKNEWGILPRTRPSILLELLDKKKQTLVKEHIRTKGEKIFTNKAIKEAFLWAQVLDYFIDDGEVAGHGINKAKVGNDLQSEIAILFEFRAIPTELEKFTPKVETAKVDVKIIDQYKGDQRTKIVRKINEQVNKPSLTENFNSWYHKLRETLRKPPTSKAPVAIASINEKAQWLIEEHNSIWEQIKREVENQLA